MWKTDQEANSNINPKSAEIEMRAQIDIALENVIDVTHIDCHMGTVILPKFIQSYLNLSKEYKILALLPRVSKTQLIDFGFGNLEKFVKKMMRDLEREIFPLIDHL